MNIAHLTPGKVYGYTENLYTTTAKLLIYANETINHWAFTDSENQTVLLHKHQIETYLHEITT